jgi:hypothetical protein
LHPQGKRKICWMSAREFEALVQRCDDVILIDLGFSRTERPAEFHAPHVLFIQQRGLLDVLQWSPSSSSVAQTASKYGIPYSAQNSPAAQASGEAAAKLVDEARLLEEAGASLLDFTNSGPVAGAAVTAAVKIPVIGGFGGGPWLDGRVRLAHTAIGYGEKWLDATTDTYFNSAKATRDAFTALIADARAGRQIKG